MHDIHGAGKSPHPSQVLLVRWGIWSMCNISSLEGLGARAGNMWREYFGFLHELNIAIGKAGCVCYNSYLGEFIFVRNAYFNTKFHKEKYQANDHKQNKGNWRSQKKLDFTPSKWEYDVRDGTDNPGQCVFLGAPCCLSEEPRTLVCSSWSFGFAWLLHPGVLWRCVALRTDGFLYPRAKTADMGNVAYVLLIL